MVGEVTDNKRQAGNAALLSILGVLVVLIVALVVGLVVHNTINNVDKINNGEIAEEGSGTGGKAPSGSSDSSLDVKQVYEETMASDGMTDREKFEQIQSSIMQYYADTDDVDATIAKYNEAVQEANDDKQLALELEFFVRKLHFMTRYDRCDEAMTELGERNLDELSSSFLAKYYTEAVGISIDCNDATSRLQWQARLDDEVSKRGGGGYGG